MEQRTETLSPETEPAIGWCHWHKGPSETAVTIDVIEQMSGPGIVHSACAPCREQRDLVPYLDRP